MLEPQHSAVHKPILFIYLFIFANEQLWLLYLYQEDSQDISVVHNIIFILTAKEKSNHI